MTFMTKIPLISNKDSIDVNKIANQNHMIVLACTIKLSCSFEYAVLT